MDIIVKKWEIKPSDHLWLEDSLSKEYILSDICDGCGATMERISQIANAHGEIGLITGYCPVCGYIKRMQNLSSKWYRKHFSKKWLVKREEEVIEDRYLYNRLKPYIKQEGVILDVGCGLGERLLPFKKSGYDVYGVEPSEERSGKASKVLDNIVTGTGEEFLEDCNKKFDVIYFFNVLQFVANPFYLLEIAAKKLKVGGIIFLKIGLFQNKGNFCQFSHLGVIHSSLNLYSFKDQLCRLHLSPIGYSEHPHEIILKKDNNFKASDQIFKSSCEVNKKNIQHHIANSLKINWLRIMGKTVIKFHDRKVSIRLKRPLKELLPVTFIHESDKIPILLK